MTLHLPRATTLVMIVATVATMLAPLGAAAAGYQQIDQFKFPLADGAPTLFDNLAGSTVISINDGSGPKQFAAGSLLAVSTHDLVTSGAPEVFLVRKVAGAYQFTDAGPLPLGTVTWPSFGAAFLEVSPDGSRVAIGNNQFGASNRIGVFNTADLNDLPNLQISWYSLPHSSAAWLDNRYLAINSGNPDFTTSKVTLLDTQSSGDAPLNPTLVNIVGNSAGVGFTATGHLVTGIGYGTGVGQIREFQGNWLNAFLPDGDPQKLSPVDFSTGQLKATVLSAGSLRFDAAGNLAVGGGDQFGGGPSNFFDILDPAGNVLNQFDPSDVIKSVYGVTYNEVTHEFYAYEATNFLGGDPSQVFVYDLPSVVPEPSTGMLLVVGVMILGAFARRKPSPGRDH